MHASIARMEKLATLGQDDLNALLNPHSVPRAYPAKRELLNGPHDDEVRILLRGWAGRVDYMPDGRRQITSLILPGEFVDPSPMLPETRRRPALVAFTPISIGNLPSPTAQEPLTGIRAARAASRAIEEACLRRHITRLGRMNAFERTVHLLLEISERLALADLETNDRFAMPLTQEELADYCGLTSVHVNRTLQYMRGERLIDLRGKTVNLLDRAAMIRAVAYTPLRPGAAEAPAPQS